MSKITIEIKSCKECPNFTTKNQYSTDGWDRMEDWHCNAVDRKIQGAVEWHEEKKIKIPEWCPVAVKEASADIPEVTVERLLEVINRLPHSEGRVPYTYHHDYLRLHSKLHYGMSRSEVAACHKENEIELHAVALTQLIADLTGTFTSYVSHAEFELCKHAELIADTVIARYNETKS